MTTLPTLPQSLPRLVIEALQAAGATEEMIAAAVKASGEFPAPQAARRGRPRKYADDAARKRDWKRGTTKRATKSVRGDEKGDEMAARLGGACPPGDEKGDEIPSNALSRTLGDLGRGGRRNPCPSALRHSWRLPQPACASH
jgi:hypothetical protein